MHSMPLMRSFSLFDAFPIALALFWLLLSFSARFALSTSSPPNSLSCIGMDGAPVKMWLAFDLDNTGSFKYVDDSDLNTLKTLSMSIDSQTSPLSKTLHNYFLNGIHPSSRNVSDSSPVVSYFGFTNEVSYDSVSSSPAFFDLHKPIQRKNNHLSKTNLLEDGYGHSTTGLLAIQHLLNNGSNSNSWTSNFSAVYMFSNIPFFIPFHPTAGLLLDPLTPLTTPWFSPLNSVNKESVVFCLSINSSSDLEAIISTFSQLNPFPFVQDILPGAPQSLISFLSNQSLSLSGGNVYYNASLNSYATCMKATYENVEEKCLFANNLVQQLNQSTVSFLSKNKAVPPNINLCLDSFISSGNSTQQIKLQSSLLQTPWSSPAFLVALVAKESTSLGAKEAIVCVGDLFLASDFRGGSGFCFSSSLLWHTISSTLRYVESNCGTSSSSHGQIHRRVPTKRLYEIIDNGVYDANVKRVKSPEFATGAKSTGGTSYFDDALKAWKTRKAASSSSSSGISNIRQKRKDENEEENEENQPQNGGNENTIKRSRVHKENEETANSESSMDTSVSDSLKSTQNGLLLSRDGVVLAQIKRENILGPKLRELADNKFASLIYRPTLGSPDLEVDQGRIDELKEAYQKWGEKKLTDLYDSLKTKSTTSVPLFSEEELSQSVQFLLVPFSPSVFIIVFISNFPIAMIKRLNVGRRVVKISLPWQFDEEKVNTLSQSYAKGAHFCFDYVDLTEKASHSGYVFEFVEYGWSEKLEEDLDMPSISPIYVHRDLINICQIETSSTGTVGYNLINFPECTAVLELLAYQTLVEADDKKSKKKSNKKSNEKSDTGSKPDVGVGVGVGSNPAVSRRAAADSSLKFSTNPNVDLSETKNHPHLSKHFAGGKIPTWDRLSVALDNTALLCQDFATKNTYGLGLEKEFNYFRDTSAAILDRRTEVAKVAIAASVANAVVDAATVALGANVLVAAEDAKVAANAKYASAKASATTSVARKAVEDAIDKYVEDAVNVVSSVDTAGAAVAAAAAVLSASPTADADARAAAGIAAAVVAALKVKPLASAAQAATAAAAVAAVLSTNPSASTISAAASAAVNAVLGANPSVSAAVNAVLSANPSASTISAAASSALITTATDAADAVNTVNAGLKIKLSAAQAAAAAAAVVLRANPSTSASAAASAAVAVISDVTSAAHVASTKALSEAVQKATIIPSISLSATTIFIQQPPQKKPPKDFVFDSSTSAPNPCYYATFYNTKDRMPLVSAYKVDIPDIYLAPSATKATPEYKVLVRVKQKAFLFHSFLCEKPSSPEDGVLLLFKGSPYKKCQNQQNHDKWFDGKYHRGHLNPVAIHTCHKGDTPVSISGTATPVSNPGAGSSSSSTSSSTSSSSSSTGSPPSTITTTLSILDGSLEKLLANQVATFTVTNIVPQYDTFNSPQWSSAEKAFGDLLFTFERLRVEMKEYVGGTAYFLTGVAGGSFEVPSKSTPAPDQKYPIKLLAPEFMWTAVCIMPKPAPVTTPPTPVTTPPTPAVQPLSFAVIGINSNVGAITPTTQSPNAPNLIGVIGTGTNKVFHITDFETAINTLESTNFQAFPNSCSGAGVSVGTGDDIYKKAIAKFLTSCSYCH